MLRKLGGVCVAKLSTLRYFALGRASSWQGIGYILGGGVKTQKCQCMPSPENKNNITAYNRVP